MEKLDVLVRFLAEQQLLEDPKLLGVAARAFRELWSSMVEQPVGVQQTMVVEEQDTMVGKRVNY